MGEGLVCPVSIGLDKLMGIAVREDRLPILPPGDGHISWIEAPHVAGQHHGLPRVKRSSFGYLHRRWPCIGGKHGCKGQQPSGFFSSLTSFLLEFFTDFANLPSPPSPRAATHPLEKEELEIAPALFFLSSHSLTASSFLSFLKLCLVTVNRSQI